MQPDVFSLFVLFLIAIVPNVVIANAPAIQPCLPQRVNYRLIYPCEEDDAEGEMEDALARIRGEPSRFARTGFYDMLFRQGNIWHGDPYNVPSYGFNPNYKRNGPYRL